MTKAKDRAEKRKDQGPGERPQKPDERRDLDAEIVRDLEVDEEAGAVRGGCGITKGL